MRRLIAGAMMVLAVAACGLARTHYIKTNTATKIVVGPFYDGTDHETPELGLTVGDIDCELAWDNAGTPALIELTLTASGGDNDCALLSGSENGLYTLELTAANANYLGTGTITFRDPNTTFDSFVETIVATPANTHDSLIAGSDVFHSSLYEIDASGSDATIDDLEDFVDNGYDPTNNGLNVWTVRGEAPLGSSDITTANATALSNIYLDHWIANALTDPNNVADNSILARLASGTAAWTTFSSASDSFEAIADSIIPPPSGMEQDFPITGTCTVSAVNITVTASTTENCWKDCLVLVSDSGEAYGAYSRIAYNTAMNANVVTLYLSRPLPYVPTTGTVYIAGWGIKPDDIPRGRF